MLTPSALEKRRAVNQRLRAGKCPMPLGLRCVRALPSELPDRGDKSTALSMSVPRFNGATGPISAKPFCFASPPRKQLTPFQEPLGYRVRRALPVLRWSGCHLPTSSPLRRPCWPFAAAASELPEGSCRGAASGILRLSPLKPWAIACGDSGNYWGGITQAAMPERLATVRLRCRGLSRNRPCSVHAARTATRAPAGGFARSEHPTTDTSAVY